MDEALDDDDGTKSRPEHEIDCRMLRRLRSGKSRRIIRDIGPTFCKISCKIHDGARGVSSRFVIAVIVISV